MLRIISKIQARVRLLVPRNESVKGISVLVSGTVLAQITAVVSIPLLTRLYTPEAFGLLAVYGSLVSIIGVIVCLKYDIAIPLPEDSVEATNLAALGMIIACLVASLVALATTFASHQITAALGTPQLQEMLWLLPLGVFVVGIFSVFKYFTIRTRNFNFIATSKIKQAISILLVQITLAKAGGHALLIAHVAGQSVGALSLGLPTFSSLKWNSISFKGIFNSLVRYQHFPLFSTWSGLMNTIGKSLPAILFASTFGPSSAGFYALAYRVSSLPASLVSGAISDVFYSQVPAARKNQSLARLYSNYQTTLIQLGLPFTIILALAAPKLFEIIFGAEWYIAGEFTRWLALGTFVAFVASPLSTIFPALEKQKVSLILQVNLFLSRLLAILIGVYTNNIIVAVALFSISSCWGYSLYIIVGAYSAGAKVRHFWKSIAKTGLYSIGIAAPTAIASTLPGHIYLAVGLCITVCLLIYFYAKVLTYANRMSPQVTN